MVTKQLKVDVQLSPLYFLIVGAGLEQGSGDEAGSGLDGGDHGVLQRRVHQVEGATKLHETGAYTEYRETLFTLPPICVATCVQGGGGAGPDHDGAAELYPGQLGAEGRLQADPAGRLHQVW